MTIQHDRYPINHNIKVIVLIFCIFRELNWWREGNWKHVFKLLPKYIIYVARINWIIIQYENWIYLWELIFLWRISSYRDGWMNGQGPINSQDGSSWEDLQGNVMLVLSTTPAAVKVTGAICLVVLCPRTHHEPRAPRNLDYSYGTRIRPEPVKTFH